MASLRCAGRALIVATLALASAACGAERYTAAPIQARVVDSENGAPIEGVNVVAAWEAKGGLEGGNVMGYVTVMEDVTNAKGEFSFPGWGPKQWRNGAIRSGAPLLILFKPGYEASILSEWKYGVEYAPSQMSSSWDGKTIQLKRFFGSAEEYSRRLSTLHTKTMSLIREGRCTWRSIPRFLMSIDRQRQVFENARTRTELASLDYLHDLADKSCGSLKTYVLEHGR